MRIPQFKNYLKKHILKSNMQFSSLAIALFVSIVVSADDKEVAVDKTLISGENELLSSSAAPEPFAVWSFSSDGDDGNNDDDDTSTQNSLFGIRGYYGNSGGYSSTTNNYVSNNGNIQHEHYTSSGPLSPWAHIFINPDGYLTNGFTHTNSTPLVGTLVNGTLVAVSPNYNEIGLVSLSQSNQLRVVKDRNPPGLVTSWVINDGLLQPNGDIIVACPDVKDNSYLYADVSCPNGSSINLGVDQLIMNPGTVKA